MWSSVWITTLLAFFIVAGNCIPVDQETEQNSNDDGAIASSNGPSNTEENGSTMRATVPTNETDTDIWQLEGSAGTDKSEEVTTKCPCEAEKMKENDGKSKRSYDPDEEVPSFQSYDNGETVSEDYNTTEDGEEILQTEADFVPHIYDYSIKNDSQKREKRNSRDESVEVRKKRQSGEAVPYVKPYLSRRDIPAYPPYLAPMKENTAERSKEVREMESEVGSDNGDEDDDSNK